MSLTCLMRAGASAPRASGLRLARTASTLSAQCCCGPAREAAERAAVSLVTRSAKVLSRMEGTSSCVVRHWAASLPHAASLAQACWQSSAMSALRLEAGACASLGLAACTMRSSCSSAPRPAPLLSVVALRTAACIASTRASSSTTAGNSDATSSSRGRVDGLSSSSPTPPGPERSCSATSLRSCCAPERQRNHMAGRAMIIDSRASCSGLRRWSDLRHGLAQRCVGRLDLVVLRRGRAQHGDVTADVLVLARGEMLPDLARLG
eukprot:scaffold63528_cov48-Phaeocystis_antarctica.AAC.1